MRTSSEPAEMSSPGVSIGPGPSRGKPPPRPVLNRLKETQATRRASGFAAAILVMALSTGASPDNLRIGMTNAPTLDPHFLWGGTKYPTTCTRTAAAAGG
ncbi:hypothetical protein GCM10011320_58560 [Neoroseomonas lacus]|uniref:Uncharacterized protein n=1 Tax=Neoroseomonas lacus TaxID=287609 RepID=A0A917NZ32_9PROT|nr:hypothetical protein GCM10011320_58560 [Neoroseomonas lacus]